MKIINRPRCSGKSTRAVWASELYNIPILTHSETSKKILKELAKREKAEIPEPMTIYDLSYMRGKSHQIIERGIIIDELFLVLESLLSYVCGFNIPIKLVTFSEQDCNDSDYQSNETEQA